MNSKRGLTLIELLVAIVIVAVLATIAIPGYSSYLVRARRADGKTALEQLRASQEMFRAERGAYSANLNQLINSWGVPATSGDYAIVLAPNTGTGGYVAEARPTTSRQTGDGSLFINQDGVKTPADKWSR